MEKRKKCLFWLERFAAPILSLALLLLWQVLAMFFGASEFVLPTPWAILKRMVVESPLLLTHAYVTLLEVVSGFLVAVIWGVPLALLIFYSRIFERAVYPVLVALQTVPKVALAPLLVSYLGYGWMPKITLAFLISFFPIVISTVIGLQALDKNFVHLVRSMGANEWQTFVKIRLPAALPNIFGGFKVAIALAVIGAVIGEYIAAAKGLGYVQLQANSMFDTTLNFAAVVAISLLGVLLYFLITLIENMVVYQREAAK